MYERGGWEEEARRGWCEVLRAIGDVGIDRTGISGFSEVDYFRTTSRRGRGGAMYSTWNYEEHLANPRLNPEQDVPSGMAIDESTVWRRLDAYLGALLPVAEEAGVRLGLHPDDPPSPPTLGGVTRILTTVESYQAVFQRHPSPANGVLFCQGCFAEGGADIPAAVRAFGPERIVYRHLRNIRGGLGDFAEVFIDEGDVDIVATLRALRDVGYDGPVMMDHTPHVDHPAADWAGRSFANGYLRAALQVVEREVRDREHDPLGLADARRARPGGSRVGAAGPGRGHRAARAAPGHRRRRRRRRRAAARGAGLARTSVLQAPTVAYGSSHHHLPFGGTLSLSSDTLRRVLLDLCASAATCGLRRILLLNGHGGNSHVCAQVAYDAARIHGCLVAAADYWTLGVPPTDLAAYPGHAGVRDVRDARALPRRRASGQGRSVARCATAVPSGPDRRQPGGLAAHRRLHRRPLRRIGGEGRGLRRGGGARHRGGHRHVRGLSGRPMIDFHVHQPSSGGAISLYGNDPYDSDAWIAAMDHFGIERSVVFTLDGLWRPGPAANDALREWIGSQVDRLVGFGTVDPQRADAAEETERCLTALGFRGMKFHPWAQGVSPQQPC